MSLTDSRFYTGRRGEEDIHRKEKKKTDSQRLGRDALFSIHCVILVKKKKNILAAHLFDNDNLLYSFCSEDTSVSLERKKSAFSNITYLQVLKQKV